MTVDLIGPLQPTDEGANYAMVMIDDFSKEVHVAPLKRKERHARMPKNTMYPPQTPYRYHFG